MFIETRRGVYVGIPCTHLSNNGVSVSRTANVTNLQIQIFYHHFLLPLLKICQTDNRTELTDS